MENRNTIRKFVRSFCSRGSLAGLTIMLLAISGCGKNPQAIEENALADAQTAYEQAVSAFEAKDYAGADEGFTKAIEAGGLSSDQLADAYFKRGQAKAATGDNDGALADFDLAEQGIGDINSVHLARAAVYDAMGDGAKAAEARAKAGQ